MSLAENGVSYRVDAVFATVGSVGHVESGRKEWAIDWLARVDRLSRRLERDRTRCTARGEARAWNGKWITKQSGGL